jgi:predicted nucleic acid-binding protein
MKPVLLDTGFIVALLDRSENFHKTCARAVREVQAPLVTCEPSLQRVAICCGTYRARRWDDRKHRSWDFPNSFQLSRDALGVKQVLRKYKDRKIDLAGACLIRLADQFGTGDILTLDRDFAIYRWGKNKSFRMLPSADFPG